jgi:hypothetical protein
MYATPFVLNQDKTNKYRIHGGLVETTVPEMSTMVPFLRDHDASPYRIKAENDGRPLRNSAGGLQKTAADRKFVRRREMSWNNYQRPISKYNAQVHGSMKIPFERI